MCGTPIADHATHRYALSGTDLRPTHVTPQAPCTWPLRLFANSARALQTPRQQTVRYAMMLQP
eukprot:2693612-Rhodomonas_salina.1